MHGGSSWFIVIVLVGQFLICSANDGHEDSNADVASDSSWSQAAVDIVTTDLLSEEFVNVLSQDESSQEQLRDQLNQEIEQFNQNQAQDHAQEHNQDQVNQQPNQDDFNPVQEVFQESMAQQESNQEPIQEPFEEPNEQVAYEQHLNVRQQPKCDQTIFDCDDNEIDKIGTKANTWQEITKAYGDTSDDEASEWLRFKVPAKRDNQNVTWGWIRLKLEELYKLPTTTTVRPIVGTTDLPPASPTPMQKQYKVLLIETKTSNYLELAIETCSSTGGDVVIIGESGQPDKEAIIWRWYNKAPGFVCSAFDGSHRLITDTNKVTVLMFMPSDPPVFNDKTLTQRRRRRSLTKRSDGFPDRAVFTIDITYKTVPQLIRERTLEGDGQLQRPIEKQYAPNMVFTWVLRPSSKYSSRGVRIYIDLLDLDFSAGDFLVIGAHPKPMHRAMSRAEILVTPIEEGDAKTIWVDAEAAYIRLVTHNSFKSGAAIRFRWQPPAKTRPDFDEGKYRLPAQLREAAVAVCLMDSYEDNFRCGDVERKQQQIREAIANRANEFFERHQTPVDSNVGPENVQFLVLESGLVQRQDKPSQSFCQVLMALTTNYDNQWPLVGYQTFTEILFGRSSILHLNRTQRLVMTNCSHDQIEFWKMAAPIGVLLIVSLVIILIAWRFQYASFVRNQKDQYNKGQLVLGTDEPDEPRKTENPMYVEEATPRNERRFQDTMMVMARQYGEGGSSGFSSGPGSKSSAKSSKIHSPASTAPTTPTSPLEDKGCLWDIHQPGPSRMSSGRSTPGNIYQFESPKCRRQTSIKSTPASAGIRPLEPEPVRRDKPGAAGRRQSFAQTKHDSLRSYPKSALRTSSSSASLRTRTISASSDPTAGQPLSAVDKQAPWRNSKVRFELPDYELSSSAVSSTDVSPMVERKGDGSLQPTATSSTNNSGQASGSGLQTSAYSGPASLASGPPSFSGPAPNSGQPFSYHLVPNTSQSQAFVNRAFVDDDETR